MKIEKRPPRGGPNARDRWLKVQAAMILTMLPEDPGEARLVLDYAQDLVNNFLCGPSGTPSVLRLIKDVVETNL